MLCKEEVTNPLQIENIGRHIELWIPDGLAKGFEKLNTAILEGKTEGRGIEEKLICVHCYINEIYQWILERDVDVADRFLKAFSLGYSKQSFENLGPWEGLAEEEEEEMEFGVCDECGEYSEELKGSGGEWLCQDCR